MENKIIVLGLGPGSKEYVLPIVFTEILKCSVIIAGKRNLVLFDNFDIKKIELEGNYTNILEIAEKELLNGNVGFGVSGDPGFHSLLHSLMKNFAREKIKVIPGISSLQYLFSKAVMSWEDTVLKSFHGKELDNLQEIFENNLKVAFLTDAKNSPNFIAQKIINIGLNNKKVIVGEKLSYNDEKISYLSIKEAAKKKFDKLSVMIVYE